MLILMLLVGTCFAGSSLLEQTAFQTGNLSSSLMMDVTRVGDRLVAVGERGIIIFSDDHGVNWSQAEVPVRVTLTAVTFPSPANGWAVGHGTVLLHSRDRGQSWDKVLDGSEINAMMVDSMAAVVKQKRLQLEQAAEDERTDLEYALEDAESNLIGLHETMSEGPIRPLMDVWFFNDQEGLIVGAFGIILRTSDGGESWLPLLDRIENPFGSHYYALAETRNAIFLFGEVGIMYRSLDKGQTWETLETVYDGSLFGAVGNPDNDCVAGFGLRGTVVSFCGENETWQYQEVGPGVALNAGVVLPDNKYAVAGLLGAVFVGDETLNNFSAVTTDFPGCLSIADAGDGHLVLAGLNGIRRITLDLDTEKKED